MDKAEQRSEVTDKIKILRITNQIHTAEDLNEIFLRVQDQILDLLGAERITIYAIDSKKNELFSKFKICDEIEEIRVKINKKSISGFVACTKSYINIADAYDKDELRKHDPELDFNQSYDIQSGFRTRQVLASAILSQRELLGVVQLINKKSGGKFGLYDLSSLREIANSLAIAFRNKVLRQKMVFKKFSSLVRKDLITEEKLNKIIEKSSETKADIISILKNEYRIEKKDILDSLSKFYYCPFMFYDSEIVIDKTLLNGIGPDYFIEKLWIPFREIDGTIEVLIDDPNNIQKLNEIKSCLNSSEIRLIGALPEDILKYLYKATRTK